MFTRIKVSFIICILLCFCGIESLKILVCYPLPVRSMAMLGHSIVRHLLEAGHEVTSIIVFPLNNPHANLRQIDINKNTDLLVDDEQFTITYILENKLESNDLGYVQSLATNYAKQTFLNENVTKLLEDTNEHFDAIIVDLMETEVYAGLAVLYDCPMIWLYSLGTDWQAVRLIDEARSPAYDTDYLSLNISPLSFAERVQQLWTRIRWQYYKTFVTLPVERDIYQRTFTPLLAKRGRTLPDYEDVMYNASLIFGNEHNAMKHRSATPQNFKHIGGFHVEDPVKPLPKNLQEIMDNSKNGVIYFSLGSVWQSKALPKSLVKGLLEVFEELNQTVIWKFEENLLSLPKNVYILDWAPQQSLLAHPNCRFFITHGGLMSSTEAIYFGVPVIGVPIQYDQFANVKKAVDNGFGLYVSVFYDLPRHLKSAINVMLNDERYTKRAKELSTIYHDTLTKPGAELVHWVQHVVRTRGAPHLRSPAHRMPLYQRLYLDLLAVILGIVLTLCFIITSMFKKKLQNSDPKEK